MIRMIATDLDGTFLKDGKMPENAKELMREAEEANVRFVVCSGRQYWNIHCLFSKVLPGFACVCENGAAIWEKGKLIQYTEFSRPQAEEIAEALTSRGLQLLVNTPYCSHIFGDNKAYTDDVFYRLRDAAAYTKDLSEVVGPILKVSGWGEQALTDAVAKELKPLYSDRFCIALAGSGWLDFQLTDKGTGLRSIAEHYGIAREEIAAFGDNFNDEPMLEYAGHPYIMADGNPGLHHRGYTLCTDAGETMLRLIRESKNAQ